MEDPPVDPEDSGDETEHATAPAWDGHDYLPPPTVRGYRILHKVGDGGMGEVYEAEQEQPVRRRVALKLIKAGMDTRQVLARFETERQALALMAHPGIARVFDAGVTDDGRPFFAMEFVNGVPITRFCDMHRYETRQRLELFRDVCAGVHHAHQKGIIHRDLKPSNILVALLDGKPVPKIIDFGLAKAMDERLVLTAEAARTEHGRAIGTPEFMSPEQADPTALDVDTRSDVYSLGVVLYVLLVGTAPFDLGSVRGATFDERRRRVIDVEPSRPSTRLATLDDDTRQTMELRGTDVSTLRRQLRGDLDWIVMKALDKDRNRRYDSAVELARDIERHLRHQPVTAGPPSAAYRVRKFVRRNRVAVAVTTIVVATLIAGAAGTLWQAVRARREAQRAQSQALKAEQTARFLQDMLASVDPSIARGRDTTLLREILDSAARRVGTELVDERDVRADILLTIGRTYRSLGLYPEAEPQLRVALELTRELHGGTHPDVAQALSEVASLMWDMGRHEEAEALHREALAIREQMLGDASTETATSLNNLGLVLWDRGRPTDAEPLLRRAIEVFRRASTGESQQLADAIGNLALVVRDEGRLAEAETLSRQALAMDRRLTGDESPEVAVQVNNLARLLAMMDKLEQAEEMHRESLALRRKLYGDEHPRVARSLHNLGVTLKDQGKLDEAEPLLRESLELHRQMLPASHPNIAWPLTSLGEVLVGLGKLDEAEAVLREAVELRTSALSADDWRTGLSRSVLGWCLSRDGRFAEAEPLLVGGHEALQRDPAIGARRRVATLGRLVELYEDWGRLAEAERYRAALERTD